MKTQIISILLLVISFSASSQSKEEKIINLDKGIQFAMKQIESENYSRAIQIADSIILLDSTNAKAYSIKAISYLRQGKNNESCQAILKAAILGDEASKQVVSECCKGVMAPGESLIIYWPEHEKWKPINSQENKSMKIVELTRNNEPADNWTEFGFMQSINNAATTPLKKAMNLTFEQSQKTCPKSKLTLIEENKKGKNPSIIFSIECPKYLSDAKSESQVWHITKGATTLYMTFIANKEKKLSKETKNKWVKLLSSAIVIKM
jgi:hypothetical protein